MGPGEIPPGTGFQAFSVPGEISPKSSQHLRKSSQNPAPDPSKTGPKRRLMLQTPKIKNNATLLRFCSFLTFPDPRKSFQNRCKNAFKISLMLHALLEPYKIRFLMVKRPQDGRPKFLFFFKSRPEMLPITVCGPRCLLMPPTACQELPGTLPRALQGLSRSSMQPPKSCFRDNREPSTSFDEEPDT